MTDNRLGKRMAKYGVVGAILAIPVPFVGPVIGAAAGAGHAWYKSKKEAGESPRFGQRY